MNERSTYESGQLILKGFQAHVRTLCRTRYDELPMKPYLKQAIREAAGRLLDLSHTSFASAENSGLPLQLAAMKLLELDYALDGVEADGLTPKATLMCNWVQANAPKLPNRKV